jgi:oxygen-independent coproporphyrinogen-3 oxidase
LEAPPVGLYVHAPFCLSICPYCDFVVYAGRSARGPQSKVDRFVHAVVAEIALRARPGPGLASVYLGGGTPSLLSAQQVARVLDAAEQAFGFESVAEITLEVNPAAADRGDIRGFRAAGVTRVSIGAQSLNADELRRLGRRHEPQDVVETVREARAARVGSLSFDLLYDVPGQTLERWAATLDGAVALDVDHVSAYALTLDAEAGTGSDHLPPSGGAERWRARARHEQDEDRAADMYEMADDVLTRAGLGWYEISNWARPGHESRHNLAYWRGRPWEAVGPGAHRYDRATRSWNDARLEGYLEALESGRLPPGESVRELKAEEDVILRLRTSEGVALGDLSMAQDEALEWGRVNGLVEGEDGRRRLTRRGRLLANELFARLTP